MSDTIIAPASRYRFVSSPLSLKFKIRLRLQVSHSTVGRSHDRNDDKVSAFRSGPVRDVAGVAAFFQRGEDLITLEMAESVCSPVRYSRKAVADDVLPEKIAALNVEIELQDFIGSLFQM